MNHMTKVLLLGSTIAAVVFIIVFFLLPDVVKVGVKDFLSGFCIGWFSVQAAYKLLE